MGIISRILPLVALGLGVAFLGNIFTRPAEATKGAAAFYTTGSAVTTTLANLGTSAKTLGEGTGAGLAGLLKPLWEIKNLLNYGAVAGTANSSPVAQSQGTESITCNSFKCWASSIDPDRPPEQKNQTITWSSGTSATVPLSQAAVDYYKKLGVSVT